MISSVFQADLTYFYTDSRGNAVAQQQTEQVCMHVHHFEIEQGPRVSEVNEKYTSSFTKGVLLPIRAGGANWYCLPVLLVSAHYGYCSNGQYLQCQALLGGVRTRIEI